MKLEGQGIFNIGEGVRGMLGRFGSLVGKSGVSEMVLFCLVVFEWE